MSSGFVSGGTVDQPAERDDEWRKAQQELEETRRRKEEESRQEGGKSLYEVLQANKGEYVQCFVLTVAAKQDAFEESIRLKNQFRNLDEDEVEFLDSVLESTRAREEAVRKETREQLELFRRQQEEADRALMAESAKNRDVTEVGASGSPTGEESSWAVNARKRKRLKEKEIPKFTKHRKHSLPFETPEPTNTKTSFLKPADSKDKPAAISNIKSQGTAGVAENPPKLAELRTQASNTAAIDITGGKLEVNQSKPSLLHLGLGSYNSDDDD